MGFRNIPKKNLTYPQAKTRYPKLRAYGDVDKDGVKNKFDCRPFDKKKQGVLHKNPYKFQDTHQERVIHSGWKAGNVYRHVLEGTGDIFREVSKHHPIKDVATGKQHRFISKEYIDEKMRRMKEHLEKEKKGIIHPDDSYNYSYEQNRDKFAQLKKQWQEQPVETKLQERAKQLNLALMDKDFETAEKIIPEIEELRGKDDLIDEK